MAQEETKINCHQCQSVRLCDIRSLDAWREGRSRGGGGGGGRGKPLNLQARTASSLQQTRKKGALTSAHHFQSS